MRELDIRTLNGRDYDLNSYTLRARKQAIFLFEEYGHFMKHYSSLRFDSIEAWGNDDRQAISRISEDKRKLRWLIEDTERKLIQLDRNYRNRRGFTWKKIVYPTVNFIKSDYVSAVALLLYVPITIADISNSESISVIMADVFVAGLFGFNCRRLFKLPKRREKHGANETKRPIPSRAS